METLGDADIKTLLEKNSYSIEIGGKSEAELEQALTEKPFFLSGYASDMMQSLDIGTRAKSREIRVTRATPGNFGLTHSPTTEELYTYAEQFGLDRLPAEAGPHARLQDRNQHTGDWYYIAMNPISYRGGDDPGVFGVGRGEDGLWLAGRWAGPASRWSLDEVFVFGLRE
ncbi:MAG: hypothetical protein Q7S76_04270 [bacterium]|nr:hypothetical protein [bacterium]